MVYVLMAAASEEDTFLSGKQDQSNFKEHQK